MLGWLVRWGREIDGQMAAAADLQAGDRVALRDPLIRRVGRKGTVIRPPQGGWIGRGCLVQFDEPSFLNRSGRQRVDPHLLMRLDPPVDR